MRGGGADVRGEARVGRGRNLGSKRWRLGVLAGCRVLAGRGKGEGAGWGKDRGKDKGGEGRNAAVEIGVEVDVGRAEG